MRRFKSALLLALASAAASIAQGAQNEPISTDRPDFLTAPDVVGRGRFQIETGALLERLDASGSRTRTASTPTLLRLGLTDTVELRIESDGYRRERDTTLATALTVHRAGWSDASLGIKWNVRSGDERTAEPAVGLLAFVQLPTGSREFRGRGTRPGAMGLFKWSLRDLDLSVNFGASYDTDDADRRFVAGFAGAGVAKGLTDRVTLIAEVVARRIAGSRHGGNDAVANVAFAYLLKPNLQLDAIAGKGITDASPKYLFGAGVSVRF